MHFSLPGCRNAPWGQPIVTGNFVSQAQETLLHSLSDPQACGHRRLPLQVAYLAVAFVVLDEH